MAINKLYPLGDKVLIKPDLAASTTASGIILTQERKSSTGTVAGVGPGVVGINGELVPLQVKPLDRVMFAAVDATTSMRTVSLNGEDYLLIPESQIFGVVEEV
jgi:chaperonin GroES